MNKIACILQWNINGYKSQYELLQKITQDENVDIICIQETNLKDKQKLNMKNYSCYNKNRSDARKQVVE